VVSEVSVMSTEEEPRRSVFLASIASICRDGTVHLVPIARVQEKRSAGVTVLKGLRVS
jgi:hypothetical protein